jgi:hypothetical protein
VPDPDTAPALAPDSPEPNDATPFLPERRAFTDDLRVVAEALGTGR